MGSGVFPLDDELGLLPGGLSARVSEGLARLTAQQPFRRAVADLAFFWGVEVSEATARRHAEAAGTAILAIEAAAAAPVATRSRRRWPTRCARRC